jgi:hypothetical protein
MGRILIIAPLTAILVGSVVWASWIWFSLGNAEISVHGYIALTLGIIGSLVVGCGLMALVFISARSGHDDQVRYDLREEDERL